MQRKVFYMVPAIVSAILILTGMLYGYSQLLVFFKTGADKAEMMLPDSDKVKLQYRPQLQWIAVDATEGRVLEEATIAQVTEDYLAADFYRYENNNVDQSIGIKDYYTKNAREKLVRFASLKEDSGQQHQGTTISHLIKPRFYAEDGTLMVLTDEVISYHRSTLQGRTVQYYDTSRYDVMLLLEDNYWRIRHKVRASSGASSQTQHTKERPVSVVGNMFVKNGEPFTLKVLNYYPQDHPWTKMWENFEAIDFAADFQRTRSLGFNAIRVFVQYETFGADKVSAARMA
ncbi:MAG: hypothetical protein AAFO69_16635, partial [Bacteroidota bacterium]